MNERYVPGATNCLKHWRKKCGWTQTDISKKVGVSRNTITSIERFEYAPNVKLACMLALVVYNQICGEERYITLEMVFSDMWNIKSYYDIYIGLAYDDYLVDLVNE